MLKSSKNNDKISNFSLFEAWQNSRQVALLVLLRHKITSVPLFFVFAIGSALILEVFQSFLSDAPAALSVVINTQRETKDKLKYALKTCNCLNVTTKGVLPVLGSDKRVRFSILVVISDKKVFAHFFIV